MMFLNIIVSGLLVTFVSSEDVITSFEQEMDVVMENLMNNEMYMYTDSVEKYTEDDNKATEPIFENGIWKCGQCDSIDESKLIYVETYNIEANYEEVYMDLQVGLSLQKMSCVIVTSKVGDLKRVSRVNGDCTGEEVTLRVSGTAQCDIRAYE